MKNLSLWSNTGAPPAFPALAADAEVDVVIVGGGITGLTAALLLAGAGQRVLLLEARRLGSGVTSGSTFHLTEAVDTRYHAIEKDFGKDGARLVAQSSRAAISRSLRSCRRTASRVTSCGGRASSSRSRRRTSTS